MTRGHNASQKSDRIPLKRT